MDGLAEFVREYPGWTGVDGYPLTWRHYRYGMAHLDRAHARAALRSADAHVASRSDKDGWLRWTGEMKRAAR